MGCGTGAAHTRIDPLNNAVPFTQKVHKYTIKVHATETGNPEEFSINTVYLSIPLPSLMNSLAFDAEPGNTLDANFISVFRKDLEKFEYVVQRLCGVEVEDEENLQEGKAWVPYINEKSHAWNEVCEKDTEVSPGDTIEWKFERN